MLCVKICVVLYWALLSEDWPETPPVPPPDMEKEEQRRFKMSSFYLLHLNMLMDAWIYVKICVVLYWALLSEDWPETPPAPPPDTETEQPAEQ
jgi:hypothetical protein